MIRGVRCSDRLCAGRRRVGIGAQQNIFKKQNTCQGYFCRANEVRSAEMPSWVVKRRNVPDALANLGTGEFSYRSRQ
jgi:hypothetical protein